MTADGPLDTPLAGRSADDGQRRPAGPLSHRRGGQRRGGHARLLRDRSTRSSASSSTPATSTSPCTTRIAARSTSRTTSTRSTRTSRTRTPGSRSGRRRRRPDGLRPADRRARLFTKEDWEDLIADGEIERVGRGRRGLAGRAAALPGPRRSGSSSSRPTTPARTCTRRTSSLLTFVGQPHRDRADPRPGDRGDPPAQRRADTRQRDRRGALGSQLEFDGDHRARRRTGARHLRRRSRCSSPSTTRRARRSRFPYDIDEGARIDRRVHARRGADLDRHPRPAPVRLVVDQQAQALGAHRPSAASTESWLGVPILAGERVDRRHRPRGRGRTPSTSGRARAGHARREHGRRPRERRLFDETQRLLAEADERAAELAIINGIQQGLAARARHAVDVRPRRRQAPGDLRRPGRRHRDLRLATGRAHFPYAIERGVRFPDEPAPITEATREFIDSRQRPGPRGHPGLGARARGDPGHPGRAVEVPRAHADAGRRARSHGVDLHPEPRPDARLQRRRRPPPDAPSPRASASPSRTPG